MPQVTTHPRVWRTAIAVILFAIAGYFLVTKHDVLRQSVTVVAHAGRGWVLAGAVCSAATFAIAAATYKVLALHRLRYGQTVLVELAASFVNRLLPAGLGGLGLHGIYLHRRKHAVAEATAVVSINNLMGIMAHLSLLIAVCMLQPRLIGTFTRHWGAVDWRYIVITAIVVGVSLLAMPFLRSAAFRFLRNITASLRKIHTRQLMAAYLLSVVLTSTYTLVLFFSEHAVGAELSVLQMFIVFSIGMLAGTATPTPGGLVGIEAGLYAGFIGYGTSPAEGAAAVLLYRLLTYWVPLLPGVLALLVSRRQKLV